MTKKDQLEKELIKQILVVSENKRFNYLDSRVILFCILKNKSCFITDFFVRKLININDVFKDIFKEDNPRPYFNNKTNDLKEDICNFFNLFYKNNYNRKNICSDHYLLFLIRNDKFSKRFFNNIKKGLSSEIESHFKEVVKSWDGEKDSIKLISDGCFSNGKIDVVDVVFSNMSVKAKDSNLDIKKENHFSHYCENVTEKIKQSPCHPAIGREKEILEIIYVTNKLRKPNCILVGEAGVGKTAIVEGLAYDIFHGNVPNCRLKDRVVYSLNVAALMAGTMYRGQAEERIVDVIKELEKTDNVVLFIDEIHMIIGAGNSESSNLNLSNMLKPALARGKMVCIGATTNDEFCYIARDSALERRFDKIEVKEPNKEEVKNILIRSKKYFEDFHRISFSEQDIDMIVECCDEFCKSRKFPDKAIDVIDSYGSYLNINGLNPSQDIFKHFFIKKMEDVEEKNMGFSSTIIGNETGKGQKLENFLNGL